MGDNKGNLSSSVRKRNNGNVKVRVYMYIYRWMVDEEGMEWNGVGWGRVGRIGVGGVVGIIA